MIVHAGKIFGTVNAIPSKSALHRRLILNKLAGVSLVPQDPCTDIQTTVDCLKRLGTNQPLDLGECGAALRFLLPVSLLFGGDAFDGADALRLRPIAPLLDVLCEHGATVSDAALPLEIRGRLKPGAYRLDGGVSSQFFSGLMLTLPFLDGESTLTWTSPLGSFGYVRLTEAMLREHGVRLEPIENGYRIPGNQTAKPLPLDVEGDWSSAVPMLILGAIGGSVTVKGLSPDSLQPDRKILDVLSQCGAKVSVDADAVTVSKGSLCGFKCSGEQTPDLIPVLAALACAAEGDSVLYRLERLRYKESDRFAAICALLDSLGADYETERDDVIAIHGFGSLRGGAAVVPPDHRMIMSAVLMSAVSANNVSVPYADCLRKSYPGFLQDFCSVGGRLDAI